MGVGVGKGGRVEEGNGSRVREGREVGSGWVRE